MAHCSPSRLGLSRPESQHRLSGEGDHEDRLLAEEDLVGSSLVNRGSGLLIQDLQQGSGAQGGSSREASQLGDAGSVIGQEDGEESVGDTEADTFGLGGGSEVSLGVGVEDDTVSLCGQEGLQTALELGDLELQVSELLLVWSGIQVTKSGVCLAIEGLTAEAALPSVAADVAVSAQQDSRGTGEAVQRRYDVHGVSRGLRCW